MSLTTDLPKFRPDLVGEDPGDECYIDLTPDDPQPRTRMIFCWCPPASEKKLPGFWLGKHLVTQAQWQALMGGNPSIFKESEQQPVDSVSYEDAEAFAKRSQGKKGLLPPGFELWLPTEAQWEHACLAGRSGVDFGIGSGRALNSQMANFDGRHPDGKDSNSFEWLYRKETLPVGCFPPNAWGLHDMHGQLWEWCADWYDKDRVSRVLRGGSWFHDGFDCRAGYRSRFDPRSRGRNIGLRVSPSSIQSRNKK
ncbi:MAG: formylglycine-generating enzyme family protein [Verrucomicrobiaceae bacterium]|nr:formylglycine-generating enzyme family protein [Verrucomicrobiaceae bacterium]